MATSISSKKLILARQAQVQSDLEEVTFLFADRKDAAKELAAHAQFHYRGDVTLGRCLVVTVTENFSLSVPVTSLAFRTGATLARFFFGRETRFLDVPFWCEQSQYQENWALEIEDVIDKSRNDGRWRRSTFSK